MTARDLPESFVDCALVVGRFNLQGDAAAVASALDLALVTVDTIGDLAGADLSGVRVVLVYRDELDAPLEETLSTLIAQKVKDIVVVRGTHDERPVPAGLQVPGPRVRYVSYADVSNVLRYAGGVIVSGGGGSSRGEWHGEPALPPQVGSPRGGVFGFPTTDGEDAGEGAVPPDQLYWNTRLPGNEAVLDPSGGPVVVVADREYILETALDTEPGTDVSTPAGTAGELAGTEVNFELSATAAELSPEGIDAWTSRIRSAPHLCGLEGTDPFRVRLRFGHAGRASVELRLVTKNETQLSQTLGFVVVAVEGDAPKSSGALEDAPLAESRSIDTGSLVQSLGATVRITVHDDGRELDVLSVSQIGCSAATGVDWSPDAIAKAVARLRVDLVKLAKRYPDTPGPRGEFDIGDHADEVRTTFAEVGARLHELVFGLPESGTTAGSIAQCIALEGDVLTTMQVDDPLTSLPVPWGLLYDARAYAAALRATGSTPAARLDEKPMSADLVDDSRFWGRRFVMWRHAGSSTLLPRAVEGPQGVNLTPIVNVHLGDGIVRRQRAMLEQAAAAGPGGEPGLTVEPVISTPQDLLDWARAGATSASDVVYFFCHARAVGEFGEAGFPAPAADPGSAALGLGADDLEAAVTLEDLGYKWGKPRERRPLVLLNACGSTQADPAYGLPFVRYFVDTWQARALLGTDWSVPALFADAFSRLVVDGLRRGLPVVAATRQASLTAFEQGNLYPLIYALYGQPVVSIKGNG